MLLGDILSRFQEPGVAAEAVAGLGDLALVARLNQAAEIEGVSLGEYASAAVQLYASHAPDEEWITLMGALQQAENPGAVCMKRAFAFVLHHDQGHACSTEENGARQARARPSTFAAR
jgi:hypothetical protein